MSVLDKLLDAVKLNDDYDEDDYLDDDLLDSDDDDFLDDDQEDKPCLLYTSPSPRDCS